MMTFALLAYAISTLPSSVKVPASARERNKIKPPDRTSHHSASARYKMQFKHYTLAVIVLLGLWAVPTPAEEIVQYIDVPNRIAWLPEGTDLVLRFLIGLSTNMIDHYGLALKRVKALRETLQSYPPGYGSIDMFYDNDIQQPIDKDKPKPDFGSGYAKDAFQSALKTVQQFAGKRIPPFGKH